MTARKVQHCTKLYGQKKGEIVGYVSYKFENSKICSNVMVLEDGKGKYFRSGGIKYYLKEVHSEIRKDRLKAACSEE